MNTTTHPDARVTRAYLTCGIIAGPIYIIAGIIEGLARDGFSFAHHDLSTLANGDFGWVHSTLLVTTGLLAVAAAVGLGRAVTSGPASRWAPRLLAMYGAGLTLGGVFRADAAHGFPPGTAADANAVTWHGGLHILFGAVGFVGLVAACLATARRFRTNSEQAWSRFSRTTGLFYLFAFLGIAAGSNGSTAVQTTVIALFSSAVVLGWVWVSALSLKLCVAGPRPGSSRESGIESAVRVPA